MSSKTGLTGLAGCPAEAGLARMGRDETWKSYGVFIRKIIPIHGRTLFQVSEIWSFTQISIDIIELSPCKLPVNPVNEPNFWDILWWKFMVWSVWSMQNFRILEGWYPIPMKSRRPILACKVDKPIAELWGFTDTWACWFQTQVIVL